MRSKFLSNEVLYEVLRKASSEERLALTKILDEDKRVAFSPRKLQEEISSAGGHSIVNFFRGEGTGYLDIVDDALDDLNINSMPSYEATVKYFDEVEALNCNKQAAIQKGIDYAERAENLIILKVLSELYSKLSPEEQKQFNIALNETLASLQTDAKTYLGTAAGLMALGSLGGFATYTFLTSALSVISFGTLGFGAYTAATTMLGVVLGPVGWVGLGLASAYYFGAPDASKRVRLVTMVGVIRQRLAYEEHRRPVLVN